MIVFDSNQTNKWSGRGFAINKNVLVAHKNANFRHRINLSSGNHSIKILAKNRTGNSPIYYKIVTERNVVLNSGKIPLSKTWSEESFYFNLKKNYGNGYIYIYKEGGTFGSAEVGRLIIEREEVVKKANKRLKNKKPQAQNTEIYSPKKALKKVIGFVIPYSIYGGAEVYLESIINNIDSSLFKIHVIYLKDNPLKYSISNRSVTHKLVSNIENFINYVKNYKLDFIVYYNSLNAYKLIQRTLPNLSKKPKIVEIYHSDFKWADSLSKLSARKRVDIAFKVAPNLLSNIKGIKRQIHLPVPIDSEKFSIRDIDKVKNVKLNIPNHKKIVGTVARLSAEKNLDYILDIAKKGADFNFLIFGEGNQEQHLRKRIAAEGIDNVHLMGFKKDVFRYYGVFDAFLLASRMEGTPISILEAMSSGVPVFTTNVGEIESIVQDKITGFFISGNPRADIQLIRENIFDQDTILAARKYIEETHSQEIVAAKFISSIMDIQNHFVKNDKIKILKGEYI